MTARRTCAVALSAALLLAACGGNEPQKKASPIEAVSNSYAKATDLPGVELDPATRPAPPKGFTDGDMDALAERLVDMATRGLSQNVVDAATDEDAYDYVMENQYADTKTEFAKAVAQSAEAGPWVWTIADRFPKETQNVGAPKILQSSWETETRTANGKPLVTLRLQMIATREFKSDVGLKTIATRRTISLAGFDPDGGEGYWPSMGAYTTYYGVDDCQAAFDGVIAPAADPSKAKSDLADLKVALAAEELVPADDTEQKDYEDLKAECKSA